MKNFFVKLVDKIFDFLKWATQLRVLLVICIVWLIIAYNLVF